MIDRYSRDRSSKKSRGGNANDYDWSQPVSGRKKRSDDSRRRQEDTRRSTNYKKKDTPQKRQKSADSQVNRNAFDMLDIDEDDDRSRGDLRSTRSQRPLSTRSDRSLSTRSERPTSTRSRMSESARQRVSERQQDRPPEMERRKSDRRSEPSGPTSRESTVSRDPVITPISIHPSN